MEPGKANSDSRGSTLKDDLHVPDQIVIQKGQILYLEERLRIENYKLCSNAIIGFRDWRSGVEKAKRQIIAKDIPNEYIKLIAILTLESAEPLDDLAIRINNLLSPFTRSKEAVPMFLEAIKYIITVFAYVERYGLSETVTLTEGAPSSIPRRFCFYRWQLHDTEIIPNDILKVATLRRKNRKLFSNIFTKIVKSLPVSDRKALFDDDTADFLIDVPGSGIETKTLSANENGESDKLFSNNFFESIKENPNMTVAPYISIKRKKICPSFATLFLLASKDRQTDLKKTFLSELSSKSKKRRGIRYTGEKPLDLMHLIWTNKRTPQEETVMKHLKMKLLQFHENVRPAYYGTWTKAFTENIIRGSRPFARNTNVLNYEEDSEAEWDHDVDDNDDIHSIWYNSENSDMWMSSGDEYEDDGEEPLSIGYSSDSEDNNSNTEKPVVQQTEATWVVPEGYLSENEGVYVRQRKRTKHKVMSRPARWPIAGSKHFPMKPVIIGPSFEVVDEPENHPLSDFKAHFLHIYTTHMNPFDDEDDEDEYKKGDQKLNICVEPTNELKPPLFQREVDKIIDSTKKELIQIILNNKAKTMMGLVSVLKTKKEFNEYTTAQLQAMIHDLAVQEIRESNKEYNWYLRT